jgi:DNA-binding transcriptional ArsR family regulator
VRSLAVVRPRHFVYDQTMNADRSIDPAVAAVASAIGEPARARMLYCLMDGHARTSTELAVVADVSPSTASVHLNRLSAAHLVTVLAQGRHRYYSLGGADVANVLEALSVVAGSGRGRFVPSTLGPLRAARTCYDHLAGAVAVQMHDRFRDQGWLAPEPSAQDNAYSLTRKGTEGLARLGIDVQATRSLRRRFAFGCLDWSERRFHVGGAIGAALLGHMLKKKWVTRHLDSRALRVTSLGQRELHSRFGIDAEPTSSAHWT